MIGRPVKGRGFRGALDYLGDKDQARLIGGNMAGRTPRELAREFGVLRARRPSLERAVAHMFLRPAPGEFLSDSQWRDIAAYYLAGMGFADSPHVIYLDPTPHPHIHLIASRITYGGTVVSDSNDYRRSAQLIRNIERQYGLRIVPTHPELAAPKPGDYGRSRRTGIPPLKTRLQGILEKVPSGLTLAQYLDHLHQHGVTLLPNLARTGRISGVSYVFEGYAMKGSDLGRSYTWSALSKRLEALPGDLALLRTEQQRSLSALAAPGSEPTSGVSLRREISDEDRRLFEAATRAEASLLAATRDDPFYFPTKAVAYHQDVGGLERRLRDSLDPFRLRDSSPEAIQTDALEDFARSLLPQPTGDRSILVSARVLEERAETTAQLRDLVKAWNQADERVHDALEGAHSGRNTDFPAAVEADITARTALHFFDLQVQADLHDLRLEARNSPPGTNTRLEVALDHLYALRNQIELARAEHDVSLTARVDPDVFTEADDQYHLAQRRVSALSASEHPFTPSTQGRIADLSSRHSSPRWGDPPQAPPNIKAQAADLAEFGIGRTWEALHDAPSAEVPEKLAEFLYLTGGLQRTRILDALDPSSSLSEAERQTGHELFRRYASFAPDPADLTLAKVASSEADLRAASENFLGLVAAGETAHSGYLWDLDVPLFKLNVTAYQAAFAAGALESPDNTPAEDRDVLYLRLVAARAELASLTHETDVLSRLGELRPHQAQYLESAKDRLVDLIERTERLEEQLASHLASPPRPAGPVLDYDTLAADFRAGSRFSSEPQFFLPPTREELPQLAGDLRLARGQHAEAESALRHATPETYADLALAHAASAVALEEVNQRIATFGVQPVPQDIAPSSLLPYLETRFELHEVRSGQRELWGQDPDALAAPLEARLADLHRPVTLPSDLSALLTEHRLAYRDLDRQLASPSPDTQRFQQTLARALDRHAELEQASSHLEGLLLARRREHAVLSSQGTDSNEARPRRLLAIERQIQTVESLYLRTRIAIADRDLGLLDRHLLRSPSTETLERYTQLLEDRAALQSRLRDTKVRSALDPERARQAFLAHPSEATLRRYRLSVLAASQASQRATFGHGAAEVARDRAALWEALRNAESPSAGPARGHARLHQAANQYLDSRQELADHAPLPPRRGTTFDYAAHARGTDLSPAALEALRRKAYLDYRRSPSPNPIVAPRDTIPSGLSREQALVHAVRQLKAAEAQLNTQLRAVETLDRRRHGQVPASTPLSPETNRRLVQSIDNYQHALAQVDRLSRTHLLSPREFLRHRLFGGQPHRGLVAWTRYATQGGLKPPQVRRSLRSLGYPFAAGVAARAAQNAVSRFFQDRIHER